MSVRLQFITLIFAFVSFYSQASEGKSLRSSRCFMERDVLLSRYYDLQRHVSCGVYSNDLTQCAASLGLTRVRSSAAGTAVGIASKVRNPRACASDGSGCPAEIASVRRVVTQYFNNVRSEIIEDMRINRIALAQVQAELRSNSVRSIQARRPRAEVLREISQTRERTRDLRNRVAQARSRAAMADEMSSVERWEIEIGVSESDLEILEREASLLGDLEIEVPSLSGKRAEIAQAGPRQLALKAQADQLIRRANLLRTELTNATKGLGRIGSGGLPEISRILTIPGRSSPVGDLARLRVGAVLSTSGRLALGSAAFGLGVATEVLAAANVACGDMPPAPYLGIAMTGGICRTDYSIGPRNRHLFFLDNALKLADTDPEFHCLVKENWESRFVGWKATCTRPRRPGLREIVTRRFNGNNESFSFGRALQNGAIHANTLRSTLDNQSRIAIALEVAACCEDANPRPSDDECRRYGISFATPATAPGPGSGSDSSGSSSAQ